MKTTIFVPPGMDMLKAKYLRDDPGRELPLILFGGLDVRTHNLTEQVQARFPRSKRKRIRKKWRRNPHNWKTVPIEQCFFFEEPESLLFQNPPLEFEPKEYTPSRSLDLGCRAPSSLAYMDDVASSDDKEQPCP